MISGLTRLIKEYAETRNGRIAFYACVYLFIDRPGRSKRLTRRGDIPFEERTDIITGKPFALFRGRGARCPHPDKWAGKFPMWAHKEGARAKTVLPAKECKACEFHEPAKKYGRHRYAACKWYRENNDMAHPLKLYANAIDEAKKIVEGLTNATR